ncbi:hypothetical protein ABPG74_014543 [Tetrahymena malaccensis]
MCLYCRIDHVKTTNHEVIPIIELAEKIQILQKPSQIEESISDKISLILQGVRKKIIMKLISDIQQTNYFVLFDEIKSLDLSVQKIISYDSEILVQVLNVLNSYNQEINQDLKIDESVQNEIMKMVVKELCPIKQNKLFENLKDLSNEIIKENYMNKLVEQQQDQYNGELYEELLKEVQDLNEKNNLLNEDVKCLQNLISIKDNKIRSLSNEVEALTKQINELKHNQAVKEEENFFQIQIKKLQNLNQGQDDVQQLDSNKKILLNDQNYQNENKKSKSNKLKIPQSDKIQLEIFDQFLKLLKNNFSVNMDTEYQQEIVELVKQLSEKLEEFYIEINFSQ